MSGGKKIKLYHGTNAQFDDFDPSKSGGIVSFVEEAHRGSAYQYASGQGGQRKRLKDTENFLVDHNNGVVYELDPETKVWNAIGEHDGVNSLVTREGLGPLPKSGFQKQLSYEELMDMADDDWGRGKLPEGFGLEPKSARIVEREFEDLNILDSTKKEGLEKLAALENGPHPKINQLIASAKRDLNDSYYPEPRGYNFGSNFWSTTKYSRSHEAALHEGLIKRLQDMGYDAIRHFDDSHPTVAVFGDAFKPDYNLNKKLKRIVPTQEIAEAAMPGLRQAAKDVLPEMATGALKSLGPAAALYTAYDMMTGGDPLGSEVAGDPEPGGMEDQYAAERRGEAMFNMAEQRRRLAEALARDNK